MKLTYYIRLLLRKALWAILLPLLCAASVYWLTRDMPKEYISSTTLYTGVASGYSITNDGDQRIDYFAVNNAFDNLMATAKSRETLEEVSLHLLAEHLLLKKPDYKVLGAQGYENLEKVAGRKLMQEAQSLQDTQKVFNYLESIYTSKADNPIARILDDTKSFYSIDNIRSNIVVSRINSSDMIQIVCTCSDPAVCMRILELHSQIFIDKYKGLKTDQTNSAVEYFEGKLKEVKTRLQSSEEDIKVFGQKNQVINYYEQTKSIALAKEDLDKEIYKMKMDMDASQEALKLVENKLNSREKQITNSTNLMRMRQQLSSVDADIEVANVYANEAKVAELSKQKMLIEDSIKHETSNYNTLSYSLETVPRTDLINEWVTYAIKLDKDKASFTALNNQSANYLNEYNQFAPLGSTLKSLDRQADINEQEFLSILHGLNLARLRQSSISLSSNIVVIDNPFFPLQAEASKRLILVIAAFLVGFIAVGSVVIGKDVLDSSIRTPERAKKIIGLPLGGVALAEEKSKKEKAYQQPLSFILTEQLVNTLLPFVAKAIDEKGQAQVSFITTRTNVYKANDIQLLHEQLETLYDDAFWVIPQSSADVFSSVLPKDSFAVYKPGTSQLNYKCISSLANKDLSENRLIMYVSPVISQHALPVSIIKSSEVNLLAFNAGDTWQPSDKEFLVKTRDINRSIPFFTWLVNTSEVNIDSVVGEIPKKRSWLRKKVKKTVSLNLNSNA